MTRWTDSFALPLLFGPLSLYAPPSLSLFLPAQVAVSVFLHFSHLRQAHVLSSTAAMAAASLSGGSRAPVVAGLELAHQVKDALCSD